MQIYYCVVGQMFHTVKHDELKKSYVFNATMAAHYKQRYVQHCQGWNFTKALFLFYKWKRYSKAASEIEQQLNLSTFINKN